MNRSRLAALAAGAMFLVAAVIVPATALADGTGSVSLSPSTVSTSTGSTFTVTINTQAATAMSGASAAVDFDRTKLQVISVTSPAAGTGWNPAGVALSMPSVSVIATANLTGHLPKIIAYFTDGTSSLPANTNEVLATVTFFAIAAGNPTISLTPPSATPPLNNETSLIDGAGATYGTKVVTTVGGGSVVAITAGGAGNQVGQNGATNNSVGISANVTGSVAAPTLALTCDAAVVVPLTRNANNTAPFQCVVGSNGAWRLSIQDINPTPATHGHLVDAAQATPAVLFNSLHAVSSQLDVDLAASAGAAPLFTSQNGVTVPLNLTQLVNPGDKGGSYAMSVVLSAINTF